MIIESNFKASPLLSNRHLQTLLGPLFVPVKHAPEKWQTFPLYDDDFLEIAWFGESSGPLLLITHGLEGCYKSHYIQRVIAHVLPMGWQVAVLHFRSCGRGLNRRMESYHSGASHDLKPVAQYLAEKFPERPKFALGFSLGGNVLLKWLGEESDQRIFNAAMAVSVPMKLDVCATAIDRGFSKIYQKHLIDLLISKTVRKSKLNLPGPQIQDIDGVESLKNFWQFDERVTAPLHGFKSAADYYKKSSSFYYLKKHTHTDADFAVFRRSLHDT